MLSPRQIFEDNIRPADLLLKVYRLLEHDKPNTEQAILAKLRQFVPRDKEIAEQFKNLTFNLDECLRLLADPDPLFIALKMISFVNFSYLSGKRGVHVTGVLLGIDNPWKQIADRLGRDEEELKR